MLFTALIFVAALVASTSGSCVQTVTCPCGSSGKTYTFCIDGLVIDGDPCDRWTQCAECREGYPYCVKCPPGRIGGLCVTVSVRKPKRRKRQSNRWRNTDLGRSSRPRRKSCSHPGVDPNGEIDALDIDERRRTFDVGTVLSYTCKSGFYLQGEKSIYCLPRGEWNAERPKCAREASLDPVVPDSDAECVEIDSILHGQVDRSLPKRSDYRDPEEWGYPIGTKLRFSCDDGYNMVGSDRLECNTHGFWTAEAPKCIKADIDDPDVSCVSQDLVLNGRVYRTIGNQQTEEVTEDSDIMSNPVGTQLQFACNRGYSLYGQAVSICEPTGFWSAVPPACVKG